MPIPITCGGCGTSLRAPDNAAGRQVRCPKCGGAIPVGQIASFPAAPPPAPARRPEPPPRGSERGYERPYDTPDRPGRGGSYEERFTFDGGPLDYLGTGILAWLLTVFTLMIGFPWALCLVQRWRLHHTMIGGPAGCAFTGTGGELFVLWLKCFLLTLVTLGIYSFWVVPALLRWVTERTEFDRA